MQTGTGIPHVPPRVKFRAVSVHSGQFRPISTEMQISASIGFGLLLTFFFFFKVLFGSSFDDEFDPSLMDDDEEEE